MRSRAIMLCLSTLVILTVGSGVAHADPLVLTINNPVQNISYNGTAIFFGSLTNQTPGRIIIDSYAVTRLPPFDSTGVIGYGSGGPTNPLIPSALFGMTSTGDILLFTIGVAPGGTFNGEE